MTNIKSPFEPLSPKEKSVIQKNKKDYGTIITPVPDNAPQDIPAHWLGVPVNVWNYLDFNGKLLQKVCRFDHPKKDKQDKVDKEFFPLTYRRFPNGSCSWEWKGLDEPRPLYGLDRLAENFHLPILICEGEKSADAAQKIFPDYATITSSNGSNSAHKADWTPIENRSVTIWPDNAQDGLEYAQTVAELALKAGAKSVRIVQIPKGFPQKWDLADTLPEGLEISDLQALFDDAMPYSSKDKSPDYEALKEKAYALTRESHPDEISDLITNMPNLGSIHKRLLMQLIKKQTGISFDVQKSAMRENDGSIDPDHLDLARLVVDKINRDNLLSTTSHVWMYENNGTWKTIPDRKLKHFIQNILENEDEAISRSLIDGVSDVLKSEIFKPEHEWNIERNVINVLNGELHWNGTAWELKPHCREHYSTTQLPLVYNPDAKCPRFIKFLEEIFAGDPDSNEKAESLLEMIGYTLTCHTGFERFIMLVGSGGNGKSVILDIIRLLVGKENVCAVQPSEFSNKFQRAHLHLKLANLVTEIAEGATIADAELKSITSGELITAEHKNKDPFDFQPYATCWFGTNHMPHTRDFSDAIFRRALVIPFNNKFVSGKNADPTLKSTLANELQGIFNMALEAYGRALQLGHCNEPPSCIEAKKEWRTDADQVAQFIEEMCSIETGAIITSKEIYTEYEGWTKAAGINRKLGRKSFTNRLERYGCQTSKGTGGTRLISGIRLRPPSYTEEK